MANFDEFKQKAKETAELIADKSFEFYRLAEEKTKIIAKITKLKTEIVLEKNAIRKMYAEMGKKYYDLYKNTPDIELKQTCMEITAAFERIHLKKQEIEMVKMSDSGADDDSDIEIEITVEADAKPNAYTVSDLDDNTAAAEQETNVFDTEAPSQDQPNILHEEMHVSAEIETPASFQEPDTDTVTPVSDEDRHSFTESAAVIEDTADNSAVLDVQAEYQETEVLNSRSSFAEPAANPYADLVRSDSAAAGSPYAEQSKVNVPESAGPVIENDSATEYYRASFHERAPQSEYKRNPYYGKVPGSNLFRGPFYEKGFEADDEKSPDDE